MPGFIPEELARILSGTPELRASFLVGGCVRDWLLERPVKDFDVEVFGIGYEPLAAALARWGRTDLVGRSFGVIKLTTAAGATYDFTIPRRDSKVAPGHKGFEIEFDPAITPRDAAARRDFTINSLMYDPRRGEVLDFFGGRDDLRARVLRHTSAAFAEDPLRVLRGMQFAARFDLRPADETLALSRSIKDAYGELARERVRDEWFKWAGQSVAPSAGLRFLAGSGWMEHFPEIAALAGTPQDQDWHPEGDVFTHTAHCCDALARLPEWQTADAESRVVLMLAVLAHDFGKPATTQEAVKDGRLRIVSPGHEELSATLAEQFLERIHAPLAVRKRVLPLVASHLAHRQAASPRAVRRLARRLEPETIRSLMLVITADQFGRPPRPQSLSEEARALERLAAELDVRAAAPRPVLLGRHLQEIGLPAGRGYGPILHAAFEAQLEGEFHDLPGAWRWLAARSEFPLTAEQRAALDARCQST
jgi:tRNA nucleotidyltransferase (CCA-adding enzyme)